MSNPFFAGAGTKPGTLQESGLRSYLNRENLKQALGDGSILIFSKTTFLLTEVKRMSIQLNEVKLSELACFSHDADVMELQTETFIFGVNGTGKSSIARKLKGQADANGVLAYLFDQRYIRDLIQRENLEGVFQIRDASEDVQKRLSELEGDSGEIHRKRGLLENWGEVRQVKQDEIHQIKNNFRESVWALAKSYERAYPGASDLCFKGFKRKELLEKECLRRYELTKASKYEEPQDLDFETRIKSLDRENPRIPEVSSQVALFFQFSEEENQVAKKEYRLNEDNPLSEYVTRLDIDLWVREGVQHLNESESEICPLCQQSLSAELKKNLELLISRDYEKAENCLESLGDRLKRAEEECETLKEKVSGLEGFETTQLQNSLGKLQLEFVRLQRKVKEKLLSLQTVISLDFDFSVLDQCSDDLDSLNERIRWYNESISDRKKAKQSLIEDFWSHFIHHKVKEALIKRDSALAGPKKAQMNLSARIDSTNEELADLEEERRQLLSKVTSSEPVVEEINATLRDLNLRSFSLKKLNGVDQYCVIREDGSRAENESLSEGEKTFISFLYFYHSVEKRARNYSERDKIIAIIDDPISSLDSTTLFAVSLLCRRLQETVEDPASLLEQIVFSTHNAYFFKELAFVPPRREKSAKRTFYVLSKTSEGKSTQRQFDSNPIHSAYEQLWTEVRVAASQNEMASHSLQNSMRRILENYFTLTGGMKTDFTAGMNAGEALAAESLLSWMNDGSHSVPWQIDYSFDGTDAKALVEVFRKIFVAANQVQHFELMMRQEN
ncbi:AAA family ATPase [Corynebacterium tuberculostearicum]|uniref:AAA family ATPase n=1 Tax=Corynebacterium tuberculostearicum TaxID=38304 RepID=UPI002934895D|nr:AAA family ATPase [Corynebacterium tuberculostearicum]MDV2421158.1 AAA family ATPase [Corynebacterium tuberculostearicum]